jgi:hypothetical protein
MATTMQEDRTTKLKTRKQRRSKQANTEIFAAEFVSLDTLIEKPPVEKKRKKRKGSQVLEMPRKPNRKIGLTYQLRLKSKALFDPYLKEKNPIVIEDQDTEHIL